MIRKHKKTLILSSLVTLLPILVGLILWDKLPERFTTHWGIDGQPDGWSSLPFAVFFPPLILLAGQWLCVWVTAKDPGNKDRNEKPLGLVLWIIPILSNLCCGLMYALALGAEFPVPSIMVAALGLMFVVIGNYLPKCRMNSTLGIKVPWAYTSQENWNATHRFGGRLWVIGGLLIMLCGLLPSQWSVWVMLISILFLAFVPMVYSYLYYRRQKEQGDALVPFPPMFSKKNGRLTALLLCLLVLLLLLILFSGDIRVNFGEESFTIEASFYDDLTVDYSVIESVEYRDGNVSGTRTAGFGSLHLLLGYFENEEFGTYTRYTYYKPEACVVVTANGKTLVLSGKTAAETEAIARELAARIHG